MKRIVAAAIKRDGKIVTNSRHYLCIYEAVDQLGWEPPIRGDEQGFVDQDGVFYTREEAKVVAIAANQIPPDFAGTLFSEDLFKATGSMPPYPHRYV